MARRTPTMPISPTQLKHFAAATVALTLLLAIFAGGEDVGVAAQLEATQGKNDLIAAEREKLGTKKLASKLSVSNASMGGNFGDEGGDIGGGSSGSATGGQQTTTRTSDGPARQVNGLPPGIGPKPGVKASPVAKGKPKNGMNKPGDNDENLDGDSQPQRPDEGQLAKITNASRQRSGGSSGDDN